MEVKDIFQPSENVMKSLDSLFTNLNSEHGEANREANRITDCTGCWGGSCASGITG